MTSVPELPGTPLALRTIEHVRAHVTESVANHSFRSYVFAMLHAEHEGMRPGADFDPDLLFHACAMHDLGTSPKAEGVQRFEVEGADMAAAFLTDHGVGAAGADLVWEAIALHSSPGIAERRGPLTRLTRAGIGMDFGRGTDAVTDAQGREIHDRHPRLRMVASLVDEIVRHAGRGALTAPRYSLPGELARERGEAGHPTELELTAAFSRWGE
ncbi:HD domain-containing protein [Kitasatospora sp. NPDC051914]|uniref:HD domain-containing protein n=1 Tax=Kitasatospora sp. NPDC051914 TaxID=3154945 RepID=UPI0034457E57